MIAKILKPRDTDQSGDTIVEVLLAIAIMALVLAGSYAITSRSLQQGISAREHTEAMYLLQSQIETLKFRQQLSDSTSFKAFEGLSTKNFCLNPKSNGPSDTTNSWAPMPNTDTTFPKVAAAPNPGYNPACRDTTEKYYLNISVPATYSPTGAVPPPSYWITVRWIRIGSADQVEQSQIYYRF